MKSNGNAQALGPRGPVIPRAVAPYVGGSSPASGNLASQYRDSHNGKE